MTDKNILSATVGLEVKKKKITYIFSIGEFFILNDDFKERFKVYVGPMTSTMQKMEGIADSCITQNVMEFSNFWMDISKIGQYTWIDIQNVIWISVCILSHKKTI